MVILKRLQALVQPAVPYSVSAGTSKSGSPCSWSCQINTVSLISLTG